MPKMPIKRVSMLILMQPDLEAAVNFYESLGLKKKFHLEGKWAEFDLNGTSLGLCPINAKDLPDRRTGFVLEVEDLKGLHQELIDQVKFVQEPVEALHGIMASFRDPGGNVIDIYQPTPEKVKKHAEKMAKQAAAKEDETPTSESGKDSDKDDSGPGCSSSCCD